LGRPVGAKTPANGPASAGRGCPDPGASGPRVVRARTAGERGRQPLMRRHVVGALDPERRPVFRPNGATDNSQGWSAAEPLEPAATSHRSPSGATANAYRPTDDRSGMAGVCPGVALASLRSLAPPLAILGRPVGAKSGERGA